MGDPLHSSKYCINHAERRINELIGIVNAFIKSNPCKTVNERDSRTHENILKVKLVKPMPMEIPGIVFDAINSLRSALDHAGHATAIANHTRGDHAHFPFGDTLSELRKRTKSAKSRSRNIPKSILQTMLKCKPYKRGNRLLWALNKMCNANKHEIITPFAMGSAFISFTISYGLNGPRFSNKRWNRLKNEREIARSPPGSEFQDNYQLSTSVVFDKSKIIGDIISFKRIIPILQEMLREVRRALVYIEAEAYRTGLFR